MDKKTLKLWSLEEIYPLAKPYLERLFHDFDGDYYRLGTGKYLKYGDMYWGLSFVPYYTGTGYAPACVLRGGVMADDPPSMFADLIVITQAHCYFHKTYDLRAYKEALNLLRDKRIEDFYVANALLEVYELMKNNELYGLRVERRSHALYSFRPKKTDNLKNLDFSWFVIEITSHITGLGRVFPSFVLKVPYSIYVEAEEGDYDKSKVNVLLAEYTKREELIEFAEFIRNRDAEFKEIFLRFPFTDYLWEPEITASIFEEVFNERLL